MCLGLKAFSTQCVRPTAHKKSGLKCSSISCLWLFAFLSADRVTLCFHCVVFHWSSSLQRLPAAWLVSVRPSWHSGGWGGLVLDLWRGTRWPHAALLISSSSCLFFSFVLAPSSASLRCSIFASPMPPILQCPLILKTAHTPCSCCFFLLSLVSSLSPSLPSPAPNPAAPSLCLSGWPAADAAAQAQAGCEQHHARADCQIQHGLHGQGRKVSHSVFLLELFPGFSVRHNEESRSYQCKLEGSFFFKV